jgi:hypothetical protein
MLYLVLISAVGIALCVLLVKMLANWGERQFVRAIGARLSDAETIVNEGKLPEAWAQPFRERIEAIQRQDGSEGKLERVGRQARQRYLRNLNGLINFFQARSVTDSDETRRLLFNSLKKQQEQVATASWQDLLQPEMSAQVTAEQPAEG